MGGGIIYVGRGMLLPGWSSERAAEGKTRGEKMGGKEKKEKLYLPLGPRWAALTFRKQKKNPNIEKGMGKKKCMISATLKSREMNVCTRSPKGYLDLRLKGEPGRVGKTRCKNVFRSKASGGEGGREGGPGSGWPSKMEPSRSRSR